MSGRPRHDDGISLIEALVALAVLGFGMLAVVGMQGTLRLSADTARQRAEAVRIAQDAIEDGRAFSAIAEAGVPSYADVVGTAASAIAGPATNTTYTLTRTVTDNADPRMKTLTVDVRWADRTGQEQAVRLATRIAGISPALAASLGVPSGGGPTSLPRGRHRDIPPSAVEIGDGTSRFTPPGGGSVSWLFDNLTGRITSLCSAPGVCISATAYLLSGHVNFATSGAPPTGSHAEVPPDSAFALGVVVDQTLPAAATVSCYAQTSLQRVSYYCALPVTDATPRWSGRSRLVGLDLAAARTDPTAGRFRVCRYTPVRSDTPPGGNPDHPLDYTNVSGPLPNQNFLVIRAGDGTTAYDCPADDTGTPLVNGNTWHHQPAW